MSCQFLYDSAYELLIDAHGTYIKFWVSAVRQIIDKFQKELLPVTLSLFD